jgi:hypothetical protein
MKKLLAMLLALAMCFALVACGDDDDEGDENNTTPAATGDTTPGPSTGDVTPGGGDATTDPGPETFTCAGEGCDKTVENENDTCAECAAEVTGE